MSHGNLVAGEGLSKEHLDTDNYVVLEQHLAHKEQDQSCY